MKKTQIANIIMVAIILVIFAAGILGVGYIRGWFDSDDGSAAVLTDIRGIVNLHRSGVSYAAEGETVLRTGDTVICSPGSTAVIRTADGTFTLSGSSEIEITDPSSETFTAQVITGEVFIHTATAAALRFDGQEAVFADTVALLSVRAGAQTVSVFSGSVGEAESAQTLNWLHGEMQTGTLAIQSLNDFAIAQLRAVNRSLSTCFSNGDLDKLEADRWAQKQEQLMGPQPTAPAPTQPTAEPTEPSFRETEPTEPSFRETEPSAEPTEPDVTQPPETQPPATQPPETEPPETEPPETEPPETQSPETVPPAPAYDGYCTVTIRCDTILDNWDNLDPAKAGYVPSGGVILPTVTVGFFEGETVFDVLERVCTAYGIQIEYSWTPMYNSYYIEGINHLYEFDCGFESGWMYKVNGWFPNYGCSSYYLTGDESIVWCYTCNGLGADVGGGSW